MNKTKLVSIRSLQIGGGRGEGEPTNNKIWILISMIIFEKLILGRIR